MSEKLWGLFPMPHGRFPLVLIVPPGTPDLAAADRTEERPIEKNNGMLAESRSLARSSAFAKSFSDGRFF